MKKTLALITFTILGSMSLNLSAKVENLSSKNGYNFIVKFKDSYTHESLFQTPETNKLLKKMKSNSSANLMNTSKLAKMNMPVITDKNLGLSELKNLSEKSNSDIKHVRTLALGNDLIKLTPKEDKTPEQLLVELMATGKFEYVNIERRYTNQTVDNSLFNDEFYINQDYFSEYSTVNNIGNSVEYIKRNEEDNLGRKLRIAVIDSGMLKHEDIDFVEGYDFVTLEDNHPDGTVYEKERDSDPTDLAVFNDGTSCSNGHGLAISSLIAAKGNNSVGIVGTANSEKVEIVPVRALGCSVGLTTDIFEGLLWAAGESIPGVPDIEKPVDIVNMSLGSSSLIGCSEYEQEVFDKLKEKGITVLIAAGNANRNVRNTSPASCSNIISVGAINSKGNKASYSNFGDKVDVSVLGDVYAASKKGETEYGFTTGTSNATPIVTGIVANLKIKYPDLTPTQIETILKSTANKINDSVCKTKGCGAGIVNGREAYTAIENILETKKYNVEHKYKDFKTQADSVWLQEMNKYVNACNLIKYTWGKLGSELEGVTYKLLLSENGGSYTELEEIKIPQKVYDLPENSTLAFKVCKGEECGEIQEMSAVGIEKPSICQ